MILTNIDDYSFEDEEINNKPNNISLKTSLQLEKKNYYENWDTEEIEFDWNNNMKTIDFNINSNENYKKINQNNNIILSNFNINNAAKLFLNYNNNCNKYYNEFKKMYWK